MNKLTIISVLLVILASLSACDFMRSLDAEAVMLDWEQFEEEDDTVHIMFKITNTGSKDIGEYEISFRIDCVEDTSFEHIYNGFGLDVDEIDREHTEANIPSGYVVETVKITDLNIND